MTSGVLITRREAQARANVRDKLRLDSQQYPTFASGFPAKSYLEDRRSASVALTRGYARVAPKAAPGITLVFRSCRGRLHMGQPNVQERTKAGTA
jgi:hypothetical protein